MLKPLNFLELNGDQRRESINTYQRFASWKSAKEEADRFKGSMVWAEDKGSQYLARSDYDRHTGIRRQRSLGPRSSVTEKQKTEFEEGRRRAKELMKHADTVLARQAAINRALKIGRVPDLPARIVRALDNSGLLGVGIRIVGTNAVYAYEATAGVFLDASLTTTEDIDLLFDARRRLRLASSNNLSDQNLMAILRKVDRSFVRDRATFRLRNRDGYLVDLIKPIPNPPWAKESDRISRAKDGRGNDDVVAAGIEGLEWLENSPDFEATVIDASGLPLRIVAPDPRAFAIHKFWLAGRLNRPALKRQRDRLQAEAVAQLVTRYLIHLPYEAAELTSVPRELFDAAAPLFQPVEARPA
jgi:hypothetical protein